MRNSYSVGRTRGASLAGSSARRCARVMLVRSSRRLTIGRIAAGLCACLCAAAPATLWAAEGAHAATALGNRLPVLSIGPFVGLLACIAMLPLFAGHWWEHNRNKAILAALLAVPLAAYLGISFGAEGFHKLEHAAIEYISFMALLGALFVISGGIYMHGSLSGTPLLNTVLIGIGAVIANVVGTTGASMLLIRPLLRANASRQRKAHIVVLFIFVVSNCGGLLTPLGDPPLFLGFLKGVPFEWTLRLWKEWLLVNGALLLLLNFWDQAVFAREEMERPGSQLEQVQQHEPLRVFGWLNVLLLGCVVGVIYAAGKGLGNGGREWPVGVQQALLVALAAASFYLTPRRLHENNRFGFGPIVEVAILFAGIFVTMVPALEILNARGAGLGVDRPWKVFWATGMLSSFLDNAPTYLTFAAAACGIENVPLEGQYLAAFLATRDTARIEHILAAISCGAVFMGANTYIGNGPNFMVKAIAEENGVAMPGFFGYMGYSGMILIPIFIVVTLVFFV